MPNLSSGLPHERLLMLQGQLQPSAPRGCPSPRPALLPQPFVGIQHFQIIFVLFIFLFHKNVSFLKSVSFNYFLSFEL